MNYFSMKDIQIDHPISGYKTRYVLLIVVVLAVINYVICYPGFLTIDSYIQLQQAKNLSLSNHHPALLSIIWHYLNFLLEGSKSMLALSLSLLWLSVFLLFESFKKHYPKAVLFFFVLPFTPGVLSNSAIIWKDVLFANAILLSLSISIYCYFKHMQSYQKIVILVLALVILFFGLSVKFQGRFIAPLVIFAMIYGIFKMPIKKNLATTLAIILAMWLSNVITNIIFKVQDTRSEQLRQVFDIAGISICSNIDLFPLYIKETPGYSFEKMKDLYTPVYVNPLIRDLYKPTLDDEKLATLQNAFYTSIVHHPGCYLEHRLKNFFRLARSATFVFQTCDDLTLDEKTVGPELCNLKATFYTHYLYKYFEYTKLLTRNFVFIVLNILGLLAFWRMVSTQTILPREYLYLTQYINMICIVFCLVMFFTTMASDNRYLYLVRLLTSTFLPIQAALFYKLWRQNRY